MLSGSSELDISSTEDVELTEFTRSSGGCLDSRSNANSSASYKWSTKQSETEQPANDTSFLNIGDGNHSELDIERASFSVLEGTSSEYLTRACESSSNQQRSVLNRQALTQEGFSSKVLEPNHKEGHSTRKVSSLPSLEKPSTSDHMEKPSTSDHMERHSTRKVSSLPSLEKPSTLDHKARNTTKRVSSLEPLEKSTARKDSSLNTLKGHSTTRISALDHNERHCTRKVSSLDSLEKTSTRRDSSLEHFDGPPTRRVLSLDPLERHSARGTSFLDSLKETSTNRHSSPESLNKPPSRRAESLDPLEGPSTRTVWLSDSTEGSSTCLLQDHNSEKETHVPFYNEPTTEQEGCEDRILAWFISLIRRSTRRIRHSKYYLLFHGALYIISFSAVHMGSKYYDLCYGCISLPFFMYVLGILGTCIISYRLLNMVSNRYLDTNLNECKISFLLISLLLMGFFVFLLGGMIFTYNCEPVFTPPHTNLCVKVFYNYAYYLYLVVPVLFLLLILIDVCACCDPAEGEF